MFGDWIYFFFAFGHKLFPKPIRWIVYRIGGFLRVFRNELCPSEI